MAYQILRDISDPPTAGDLVRVQQKVQAAFQELGAGGMPLSPTVKGPMYRVTGLEPAVFVDSRGGSVTVVLPDKPKGLVVLRSVTDASTPITVSAPSAKIDGAPMVTLGPLATLRLAFDGRAWWSV